MTIARRAMAPIAQLTSTAAEIARTRDPSRSVPEPLADDEVSELARTLGGMLRELDAAHAETEATLARQRQFVADASHELRTPLTSVLANLELLAESLHGEEADAARSALRSSRRMRRLVADLLLLARTDVGRVVRREPCDLAQIVVEAAAELGSVSGEHDISLDVRARGPWSEASRDELHRLALNLIENAVRHTPPGTEIRVSTGISGDGARLPANGARLPANEGPLPAGEPSLPAGEAHLPAGEARLIIEDDGPGVPERLTANLFERFVRGAGDRGGSFGLGLAIVRAVAEAHGGTVTLEPTHPGAEPRAHALSSRCPPRRGAHRNRPHPRATSSRSKPTTRESPRPWFAAPPSQKTTGLDLDHDGKHHRPALQTVVHKRREVVVEHLLEQVDLADLLLGGARERRVDRPANLLDQLAGLVGERYAAEDHLWVGDRASVLLGDRHHYDEDPVGGEHAPVAQRYVRHVADLDAVDEHHPGLLVLFEARPALVHVERQAVLALEDVLRLDARPLRRAACAAAAA